MRDVESPERHDRRFEPSRDHRDQDRDQRDLRDSRDFGPSTHKHGDSKHGGSDPYERDPRVYQSERFRDARDRDRDRDRDPRPRDYDRDYPRSHDYERQHEREIRTRDYERDRDVHLRDTTDHRDMRRDELDHRSHHHDRSHDYVRDVRDIARVHDYEHDDGYRGGRDPPVRRAHSRDHVERMDSRDRDRDRDRRMDSRERHAYGSPARSQKYPPIKQGSIAV